MSGIIAKGMVAQFHYSVSDTEGNVIDKSEETPMAYLHGFGNIVPGLETALEGKKSGDKLSVKVSPEEAYGEYDPSLIQKVPKETFEDIEEIEVGMQFEAETDEGAFIATIVKFDGDDVVVDGNHPLAGKELAFEVTVESVRKATDEELEHGHTHGDDGHEHH